MRCPIGSMCSIRVKRSKVMSTLVQSLRYMIRCHGGGGGGVQGQIHTCATNCGKCPFSVVPSHFSGASAACVSLLPLNNNNLIPNSRGVGTRGWGGLRPPHFCHWGAMPPPHFTRAFTFHVCIMYVCINNINQVNVINANMFQCRHVSCFKLLKGLFTYVICIIISSVRHLLCRLSA